MLEFMRYKRYLLFILLCIIYNFSVAQKTEVKSFVLDKDFEPMEGVSIEATTLGLKHVYSTITTSNGSFIIKCPLKDSIVLSFSHVAYHPFSVVFLPNKDTLLPIIMYNKEISLEEAAVTAKRQPIQFKDGVMICNISMSPNLQTQNMNKVLSRLPGVEVNSGGGVKLNGKSATIYIDGQKQNMNSSMASTLLESMPASSVEDVELTSINDGSKFAADGAVINIKTKKTGTDGHNFTLGGGTSWFKPNYWDGEVSAFYMLKKNNILFNTQLSYRNSLSLKHRTDSTIYFNLESGEKEATLSQNKKTTERCNAALASMNLQWDVKDGHKLNFSGFFYDDLSNFFTTDNQQMYKEDQQTSNILHIQKRGNDDLYTGLLSYASPDTLPNLYTASYSIIYGGTRADHSWFDDLSEIPDMLFSADMIGSQHTVKFDYAHIFSPKIRLDLGIQTNLGELSDNADYLTSDTSSLYNDIHFKGYENIYGTYAKTRYTINEQWSLMGTLRAELTNYDIMSTTENVGTSQTDRIYLDVFPYLHFRYVVPSKKYQATLAFTSGINRPNYQSMIPGKRFTDNYSYLIGNPGMKPCYYYYAVFQQYFLSYILLETNYAYFTDVMRSTLKMVGDNKDVSEISIQNVADMHAAYVSLYIPYRFFNEKLSGRLSVNLQHYTLCNPKNGYTLNGREQSWNGNIDFMANYNIIKALNFSAWTSYKMPSITPQIESKGAWAMDLSISYSFLKDEMLSISLDAENIFNTFYDRKIYHYKNAIGYINNRYNNRFIKLSLVVKLNKGSKLNENALRNNVDMSRFPAK